MKRYYVVFTGTMPVSGRIEAIGGTRVHAFSPRHAERRARRQLDRWLHGTFSGRVLEASVRRA